MLISEHLFALFCLLSASSKTTLINILQAIQRTLFHSGQFSDPDELFSYKQGMGFSGIKNYFYEYPVPVRTFVCLLVQYLLNRQTYMAMFIIDLVGPLLNLLCLPTYLFSYGQIFICPSVRLTAYPGFRIRSDIDQIRIYDFFKTRFGSRHPCFENFPSIL